MPPVYRVLVAATAGHEESDGAGVRLFERRGSAACPIAVHHLRREHGAVARVAVHEGDHTRRHARLAARLAARAAAAAAAAGPQLAGVLLLLFHS